MLRDLRDEVDVAVLGGTRTCLPPFARDALATAARPSPPIVVDTFASQDAIASLAGQIAAVANSEQAPWASARILCTSLLTQLPSQSDRQGLLEALGTHALGIMQYVDDGTVPCPSLGAVMAVVNQRPDSACSRYARRMRAQFNYEPNKILQDRCHGSAQEPPPFG